jgi:Tol biopolymer transport system component
MKMREVYGRVPGLRMGRRAGVTPAGPLVQAGPLMIGILVALAPVFSGCASRSPAEAENREVRLTTDGVVKYAPRFSPDGQWVAYAAVTGDANHAVAIYLLPRQGGAAKRISPDTMSAVPLSWAGDGQSIYCRQLEGRDVYQIGLDGSVKTIAGGDPFGRMVAISADGKTHVLVKFNQDNRDIGIVENGGPFQFMALTPAWEEEAVMGPGAGEVTVVATPSYQATTSTISVWSPKTRAFSALAAARGAEVFAGLVGGRPQARLLLSPRRQERRVALRREERALGRDHRRGRGFRRAELDARRRLARDLPQHEDLAHLRWRPEEGRPPRDHRRSRLRFIARSSPDGRWVAFTRKYAGGEQRGKVALCVVPTSGGEVRALDLKGIALPGKEMNAPSWSPDSRQIAFEGTEGSSKMDIYRIGRDGEGLARVTVEPGDEIEPRWSSDGKNISYTRVGAGQLRVSFVPATGGLPRLLSPEGVPSEGGLLSPHCDRVAYTTFRPDGTTELWVARNRPAGEVDHAHEGQAPPLALVLVARRQRDPGDARPGSQLGDVRALCGFGRRNPDREGRDAALGQGHVSRAAARGRQVR